MIVVRPKKTSIETQIDIVFEAPKKGEKEKTRSVLGALHFKPGVVKSITPDEFNFIKDKQPGFFKELQVLFESPIEEKKEVKVVDNLTDDRKTTKIKKKTETSEEK